MAWEEAPFGVTWEEAPFRVACEGALWPARGPPGLRGAPFA